MHGGVSQSETHREMSNLIEVSQFLVTASFSDYARSTYEPKPFAAEATLGLFYKPLINKSLQAISRRFTQASVVKKHLLAT
jgi:hypothetical protein